MTVLNVECMYVCFDVFLIQLYVIKFIVLFLWWKLIVKQNVSSLIFTYSAYRRRITVLV